MPARSTISDSSNLRLKLVMISVNTVAEARKVQDKHDLNMTVLSDESLSVTGLYNRLNFPKERKTP